MEDTALFMNNLAIYVASPIEEDRLLPGTIAKYQPTRSEMNTFNLVHHHWWWESVIKTERLYQDQGVCVHICESTRCRM